MQPDKVDRESPSPSRAFPCRSIYSMTMFLYDDCANSSLFSTMSNCAAKKSGTRLAETKPYLVFRRRFRKEPRIP